MAAAATLAQDIPKFRTGPSLAEQYPDAMSATIDQFRISPNTFRFNVTLPADVTQLAAAAEVPPSSSSAPLGVLSANASRRPVVEPLIEIPAGLERHPVRNLSPGQGFAPFTLRDTASAEVQAQLTAAIQMEFRHDDDIPNLPRPLAVAGTIAEYTPSIELNLGDRPGPRDERSLVSNYYLEAQYLPTIYQRPDLGTSRTLQRIIAEGGRASPISVVDVRFEYDENLLGASGSASPEDTYTLLEVSPLIQYYLSAKTSVRAQGFYRSINIQGSNTNRTEYVLDYGIDTETSAKTTIGIGSEIGQIRFVDPEFATQDYEQVYLAWTWKPSLKVTFQTRIGAELREYADHSKPNVVSPVTNTVLNWRPNDRTTVALALRVRNQPSVSETGTLFQEVRFASELRHEIGWKLYLGGEASIDHRSYDSGQATMDVVFRAAVGYHTEVGRLFDSLNIETYYQRQQTYSNQPGESFDRNYFGIQSTLYF